MKKIILLFVAIVASNLLLVAQTKQSDKFLAEKPGFYVLSSESLKETEKSEKPDVTKIYGKIKIVDSFPDYKIQLVESFPDFTIKFVENFPGKP